MTTQYEHRPEARCGRLPSGAAGYSVIEILVIGALISVMLAVGLLGLKSLLVGHQTTSAAVMVQTTVQRARMSALKEKRAYRIVLHDENSAQANTIEIQRDSGGSYVTVAGEVYGIPGEVRILGTTPTDSMDAITVNSRGECTSGNVFVAKDGQDYGHVSISPTCLAELR